MNFIKNIKDLPGSDAELIQQYKRDADLNVLAALYQRYMELVYGVCLKYLGDPESAKDAVMQIFEELIRKLPVHEVVSFRSWLYVLAKNHCLMQIRVSKNLKTIDLDPSFMQFEENGHPNGVHHKELELQNMERCLETLPPEQKRTVELFYLRQKCYNEIVEITGADWNRVRSLIQNGRRNLKICMEKTVNEKSER